jgi:hypothetical protein
LARAEVAEEEHVRHESAPQFPLEGVIGLGLMKRLQELGDRDAAEAVAGAAGTLPEGAGEECLRMPTDRICSKMAVFSRARLLSRGVRSWLSRRWIPLGQKLQKPDVARFSWRACECAAASGARRRPPVEADEITASPSIIRHSPAGRPVGETLGPLVQRPGFGMTHRPRHPNNKL